MDSGAHFSLGVFSCNKQRNTGGEWIEVEEAVKSRMQDESVQETPHNTSRFQKNPNHYKNSTRNIVVLPKGEIMKVHLRLMRRFNNKTIL